MLLSPEQSSLVDNYHYENGGDKGPNQTKDPDVNCLISDPQLRRTKLKKDNAVIKNPVNHRCETSKRGANEVTPDIQLGCLDL